MSDAPALIDRLKGGGFILVFRHADRYSQTGEPRQPADLGRELPQGCTQPRQALTASGFAQAKAIGESLKDVPVDNVFATTACRTIETARFAFDRSQLLEMSLDEAIRLAPANGKNTIIVSHGERIADALTALNSDDDRIPACGEAAVIDPSGDQERPECLAMVLPREWNPANGETALGWENGRECNPR